MAARQSAGDESVNVGELPQRQVAEYVAIYSNHAEIGSTHWDFRFLFFEITEDDEGNPIREKKARVVMSPQHAEAFSQALNRSIDTWKRKTSNL